MADNIAVTAGQWTGVAATDDVGGAHYQRVKLVWGADGVATDTSGAAPLPVVDTVATAWDHGANRTIATTAVQVAAAGPAIRGVWLKAGPGNSGTLYVGNADVTAGTAAATDGYPLDAGNETFIRVNNVNLIWVRANAGTNQILYWRVE